MTVRIATIDDLAAVSTAVATSGQYWSREAVAEKFTLPFITSIITTNGDVVALMFANCESANLIHASMLLGRVGPNVLTWIHDMRDLANAIDVEVALRYPTWSSANRWVDATIFTAGCQMSGQRTAVETAMAWKVRPNAISEGWEVRPDGSHLYHYKWATVKAKLATL
jgi:hypothetical protein